MKQGLGINPKNKTAVVASVVTTMISLFLFSFGVRRKNMNPAQVREWFAKALSQHKLESEKDSQENLPRNKYRIDRIRNRESEGSPISLEIKKNHSKSESDADKKFRRGVPKAIYSGVNIEWTSDSSDYYTIYLSKKRLGQSFIDWLFSSENDFASSQIKMFNDDPAQIIVLENSTNWLRRYSYNISDESDPADTINLMADKEPEKSKKSFSFFIPLEEFHCIVVSEQGNVSQEYFHECSDKNSISNTSPYNFQYISYRHKGRWYLSVIDKNRDNKTYKNLSIIVCHEGDLISEFPIETFSKSVDVLLKYVECGLCYLKYSNKEKSTCYDFAGFIREIEPWVNEVWYKEYFESNNFDKLSIFISEETG